MKTSFTKVIYGLVFLFVLAASSSIHANTAKEMTFEASDTIFTLPLKESFTNTTFPPAYWDTTSPTGAHQWRRVTTGQTPTATAQDVDKAFMSYHCNSTNGYSTDSRGMITTPGFRFNQNHYLTFWIYRDSTSGNTSNANDRLNVYITPTPDIKEVAPAKTIYRTVIKEPREVYPGRGGLWYQYILKIADFVTQGDIAYVTFEGIGDKGTIAAAVSYNIFIDNIVIGEITPPVSNFTVTLLGENPPHYNMAHLQWEKPIVGVAIINYTIYRNRTAVAIAHKDSLNYNDSSLAPGVYDYSIAVNYATGSSSSQAHAKSVTVTGACQDANPPSNLNVETHTNNWYDISLRWDAVISQPQATLKYSGDPKNGIGGISSTEFIPTVRFAPEDLKPYHGKELAQVDFVPIRMEANYAIKIWKGGSDVSAGTLVYEQALTTSLLDVGKKWNTIDLTTPVVIDSTQDLRIGIVVELLKTGIGPMGVDLLPVTKADYSNLLYLNGQWTNMAKLGMNYKYNWCIKGNIFEQGMVKPLGYYVYQDGTLITPEAVSQNGYIATVSDPGEYHYEVSALFAGTYCESATHAAIDVEMEKSPCEDAWQAPFKESFEGERFPAWCWELPNPSTTYWKQVSAGTDPTCQAPFGKNMLQFNSYGKRKDSTSLFIMPKLATTSTDSYKLSFWMYRDGGFSTLPEKLNVYMNENPSKEGATLLSTINRLNTLTPAELRAGWYEYTVSLPTAGMNGAYVMFEGVCQSGNNMYVDHISIYDSLACDPVSNIAIEYPTEGAVTFTWQNSPNANFVGVGVTRDGVIIDTCKQTSFSDKALLGQYEYCFTSLFEKTACQQSQALCIPVELVQKCDPVTHVKAETVNYNGQYISWDTSEASGLVSYTVYRDSNMLGSVTDAFYTDENVPGGLHQYSVAVNYENKACTESEHAFSNKVMVGACASVNEVAAAASSTKDYVTLAWNAGANGFKGIVFSENFKHAIPASWKNLDKDGDGYTWFFSTDPTKEGIISESKMYFSLHPDNWLVSPKINIHGTSTLNYVIKARDPKEAPMEHYGIYISTTGTDYEDFTLVFEETLTSKDSVLMSKSVDISEYTGDIYFAFRHFDSYNHTGIQFSEVNVECEWESPSTFTIYKNKDFLTTVSTVSYRDSAVVKNEAYTYCVRQMCPFTTVDSICTTITITGDVGIENISDNHIDDIIVYPNVASTHVFVKGEGIAQIDIYNAAGQLIDRVASIKNQDPIEVNVKTYNQGVYMFKILKADKTSVTKRVVIIN